jgi:diacylglycerol diphosphate phosphatase/phosphatidate phosphatase
MINRMSYLLLPQNGLPKHPETRTPPKSNSTGWITYLRIVWRDWLCLGLVALLSAGLYFTPIYCFRHRLVSINTPVSSNNIVDTHHDLRFSVDLGYPWSREPISTLACALVAVFVPASVMALFQLRLRSLWDMHAGTVGVLKAIVSTYVIKLCRPPTCLR